MHILDQLMKSVVRIEAINNLNQVSTGTGFAYRFACRESGLHVPAIVTNKHVIEGNHTISMPISVANADGEPTGSYEVISYSLNNNIVINHPDPEVDLCAIIATPIYQHFANRKQQPLLCSLDKSLAAEREFFSELLPLEEVTMVGFPNGIWDSTNNGSIARRGVIATTPEHDYLGRAQFVIDMACFPGSSGSPVFLANFGNFTDRTGNLSIGTRVKLLGILYAGPQHTASGEIILVPVPTSNKPLSLTSMPNNLGYVIKATALKEIENIMHNILEREEANKAQQPAASQLDSL